MEFGKDKIVGTFVPIFSLVSKTQTSEDQGTFETGIIFLDWLKKTGQNAWQLLPLSETQLEKNSAIKHVPSPYKGYGIGLDPKYLSAKYKKLQPTSSQLKSFMQTHKDWIEDYAFFCALRDQFRTDDWRMWDPKVRDRKSESLELWRRELAIEIKFYITQQWQLHTSYAALRAAAKEKDILLIGDLPFYLSLNSPLVWANRDLFAIKEDGSMDFVSGAATQGNSHYGRQVWGHPLYKWSEKEKLLTFWKIRLAYRAHLYDVLRFDYAIGFLSYSAKHILDETLDEILDGPGSAFLGELISFSKAKGLSVFVEDSGKPIQILRDYINESHISGIRIFRFAYDEVLTKLIPYYAEAHNYPQLTVAYTTTHDTEPLIGYLSRLTKENKVLIAQSAQIDYSDDPITFSKNIRNAVLNSPAKTVIIQLQDWLLTKERINIPGTEKEIGDTNWSYKIHLPIEDLPSTL